MKREITINPYDDEGAFALVIERPGQDPILMETEGEVSSRRQIEEFLRKKDGFMSFATRWCIVRLVPVQGNALLIEDMMRLQPKKKHDEEPF